MKIRYLLGLLRFPLLLLGGSGGLCIGAKRPNILFCFADDWGRVAGAYQAVDGPGGGRLHEFVKTPTVDRMAREGAIFRHATVSAPSCTPCRSALLSGRHFWQTGTASILNGAKWEEKLPAFPLLLRDSGYHIGKMFKVWGPGEPTDAPFDRQRHAFQAKRKPFHFGEEIRKLVQSGVSIEAAKERLLTETTANFVDFLAAKPAEAPFFFWFGPINVHRKFAKGSGKDYWGLDPDKLKGRLPPFLPDVPEVREDVCDYLGEVMAFDASAGRLIQLLEEKGELENTLVCLSGDHGPPGFPHGKCNLYDFGSAVSLVVRGPSVKPGRIIEDLVHLQDLAPTFLKVAGVVPPADMTARDLLPLLSAEKASAGLLDPKRDAVFLGRERHVASARDGLAYPQRAIRTREHLLIRNFKPERLPMGNGPQEPMPSQQELADSTYLGYADMDAGPTKAWLMHAGQKKDSPWFSIHALAFGPRPEFELFDLAKDPHQMKNVAAEPAYAEIRAKLEQRLMAELQATGDPRIIAGDAGFFEHLPYEKGNPKPRK